MTHSIWLMTTVTVLAVAAAGCTWDDQGRRFDLSGCAQALEVCVEGCDRRAAGVENSDDIRVSQPGGVVDDFNCLPRCYEARERCRDETRGDEED